VVETAAGLVAQIAGDAAAAQLRGRWRRARGRLDGRIRKRRAEGALADDAYLAAYSHQIFLLAKTTRPTRHSRLYFGVALDGATALFSDRHVLGPIDSEALAGMSSITAHRKLSILAELAAGTERAREGFLTNSWFGSMTYDTFHEATGNERAYPLTREDWIALQKDDRVTISDNSPNIIEIAVPNGISVRFSIVKPREPWATWQRLLIAVRSHDGTGFNVDIGDRRRRDDGLLPPNFIRGHERFGGSAAADTLMGTVIASLIALDLDLSEIAIRGDAHSDDADLSSHPLTAGQSIPRSQRHVIAQLLGRAFDDYRAFAQRRLEERGVRSVRWVNA
jgi:hypothetical protein